MRNKVIYDRKYNNSLPKFDRSVSLLCWAYNEEELIKDFLLKINGVLSENIHDYEIVIIDDGSTDATNQIIQNLQKDIPEIKLYRNHKNMNVGYSCRRAIQKAAKEYLFWQTIDWSYDITFLRSYLELLKTHTVVAGVRRVPIQSDNRIIKHLLGLFNLFGARHLSRRSDNVFKAFVSIMNYMFIRLLFQFDLSDYQNVVFCPTRLVQSIDIEANSSFLNPELLLKAHWQGASIVEVPIPFIPRTAGEAKGTKLKTIKTSVFDIFKLWYRWIVQGKRPYKKKGTITRLNLDEWDLPELIR